MKRTFLVSIILILCFSTGLIPTASVKASDVPKRDYIIILGTDSLKSSVGLNSFVDYKTTNFDVTVVSMPDINKQFPGVTDPVESLRQYLDTKVQPVTPYVLLVGSLEKIPMEIFYWDIKDPTWDSYTDACLEYNKPLSYFDSNANGKPGEFSEVTISDLSQMFVIGRVPTDSSIVLDTYFPLLQKAEKRYQDSPPLFGMVACAAENFTNNPYNSDKEGEEVKKALSAVTWSSLYEKEGDSISAFPAEPLTLSNFITHWKQGLDIVFTAGHGGEYRLVFTDKNHNGICDGDGEEEYINFWGDDIQGTTFLGYLNGCYTFPANDNWSIYNLPYIPNLLSCKMLNFVGYASASGIGYTSPSLTNVFNGISEGLSFGDAIAEAKIKTSQSPIWCTWWSITLAGDPSAYLKNIVSTTKSVVSEGTFQPESPVNLSWDTTPTAWTYKVQVGTSSDFTTLIKSDVVYTNNDNVTFLKSGDYFWRVCGIYDNGTGNWSEIGKITIADPLNLIINSLPSETEIDNVTISGSTNGDSVLVNGNKVAINNGEFSTVVSLDEGNNNLVVVANKGEQVIEKIFIVIYKKPQIVLVLQIGNSIFTVNGVSQFLDSPPIIKNGRTLVPIRAIIETLGGSVDWDGTARKATVALGDKSIELWIGKSIAKVNGASVSIDSANAKVVPEIINGRTMLPLRFISENLGCSVIWTDATKTITITYILNK